MSDDTIITLFQKLALDMLAKHLDVSSDSITSPAIIDPSAPHYLEYGGVKYDVKISSPVLVSSKRKEMIWDFDVREKGTEENSNLIDREHDFYLLIGIENLNSTRAFLVPIKDAPTSHIRISINGESKYNSYQI